MARTKKFYDWEYDRVVTEEKVRNQYQWFAENIPGYTKSFEQFASENFCDLSDKTQRAVAEAMHDRNGWYKPVCKFSTLMRRAK